MYGYYETERPSFHLVLEFMAGGSLKELLGRPSLPTTRHFLFAANARCTDATTSIGTTEYEYNVAQAISWMRQAACGLAYLHGEEVKAHLHTHTSKCLDQTRENENLAIVMRLKAKQSHERM